MKNLGLLAMPLMAISFLASCSKGGGNNTETYTITFDCQHCKAFDEYDNEVTSVTVPVTDSSQVLYKKFYFIGEGEFKIPIKSLISIKKTGTEEIVDYEYSNGKIFVPIVGDLTVSATGFYSKDLEHSSWNEIAEISATGKADEFFKVGDEKIVMVNNQPHIVRIIGFNHDKDKYNRLIGITFEFANLISDSNGRSIATQWNDDTNDYYIANRNYLDSSIRKALTNEGKGHILWARSGATTWSTEGDYKKSILEMLPSELTNVLVAPQKTVKCNENGTWIYEPITNNKGEYDKLFLLSTVEIGNNDDRTGAYAYYQEIDDAKLQSLRVKKQVSSELNFGCSDINSGAGQTFQEKVHNYAGYNCNETNGGFLWLRSPHTSNTYHAWSTFNDGTIGSHNVCCHAYAVAPAFCI